MSCRLDREMLLQFVCLVWFGRFPGCIGHPPVMRTYECFTHGKSLLDVQEVCIVVIDLIRCWICCTMPDVQSQQSRPQCNPYMPGTQTKRPKRYTQTKKSE